MLEKASNSVSRNSGCWRSFEIETSNTSDLSISVQVYSHSPSRVIASTPKQCDGPTYVSTDSLFQLRVTPLPLPFSPALSIFINCVFGVRRAQPDFKTYSLFASSPARKSA